MSYRLKRGGWHFKLQKWTFGNDVEHMGNMCPYFWLTNFCIMAAPFVLLWRVVARVFGVVFKPINYVFDRLFVGIESRRQHRLITFVDGISDWQAYNLYRTLYAWRQGYAGLNTTWTTMKFDTMRESTRKNLREKFKEWKNRHKDDWEDILKREYEYDSKAKEAAEKAKTEKKNKLYRIASKTKLLVLLPIGTALIYLAYYTGVLVLLAIENPDITLGIVVFTAGIALGISLLVMLANSLENDGRAKRFLKVIFTPVLWVLRPIWSVLMFFGMNIKLLYKNYCPQIEWFN